MVDMLAFVTIVVTQGTSGMPTGTEFYSTEPVVCGEAMDMMIEAIEEVGGEADGFCEYTHAPVESVRPMMRPDRREVSQ